MSKGSEFLPEVLGLIEKRLGEIDEIYRRYARTLTV